MRQITCRKGEMFITTLLTQWDIWRNIAGFNLLILIPSKLCYSCQLWLHSFDFYYWKLNPIVLIQETLLRICCAMLIIVRRRLLAGDFTSNLKLLQNYPPTNISHLLYVANKLRTHLAGWFCCIRIIQLMHSFVQSLQSPFGNWNFL